MTNIFKTQEKRDRKKRLFQIGIETLQEQGWTVTREPGLGKASVRRITKGDDSKLVSIRTSQDTWIAFPPKPKRKGWITLDDVDVVLAVSVDGNVPPKDALVHWLPADEMRERFDRALQARMEADRVQPDRRGIWIPLYQRDDATDNVSYVGGGAGLDYPPIARVPLKNGHNGNGSAPSPRPRLPIPLDDSHVNAGRPFTIAEAKRLLALSLGVPEASIKISIEA